MVFLLFYEILPKNLFKLHWTNNTSFISICAPYKEMPNQEEGPWSYGSWIYNYLMCYSISTYHYQRCEFESHPGEVYSIMSQYVVKFVSDLWQVGGFPRVLGFPHQ
jgi:hypothetical protein